MPDLPHEVVLHGDPLLVVRTGGRAPDGAAAWTVLARGRLAEDVLTALARHGIDVRRQVVARVDRTPADLVEAWGGSPHGVLWQGPRTARARLGPRTPIAGVLRRRGARHHRVGPAVRRLSRRAGRRDRSARRSPRRSGELPHHRDGGGDRRLARLEVTCRRAGQSPSSASATGPGRPSPSTIVCTSPSAAPASAASWAARSRASCERRLAGPARRPPWSSVTSRATPSIASESPTSPVRSPSSAPAVARSRHAIASASAAPRSRPRAPRGRAPATRRCRRTRPGAPRCGGARPPRRLAAAAAIAA